MIVQIKMLEDNGRFRHAIPGEFALEALRYIVRSWKWDFLRFWLCRVCLFEAAENAEQADVWIARYRAIREVK